VTVNLLDCDETLQYSTTTDENGHYHFDMLMADEYMLEFVAPEGHLFSPTDAGDDESDSDADQTTGLTVCFATLPGVDYTGWDAGLYPEPASVGDFVWNDDNMNGMQDEGELGMAGVEVQLYSCNGEWIATTVSDESGMYLFDDLKEGEYYLMFSNPPGYIFTYQNEGDDDMYDSDVDRYQKRTVCFMLEPGDEASSWDAGLYAFEGCTYGKGYWKNHTGLGPQPDEISFLLPIWLGDDGGDNSIAVEDVERAAQLLQQHWAGHPSNGITKLYAHLLTAKLNIVNFANPEDISDIITEADSFLAEHHWTDWFTLDKDGRQTVLVWKGMLEQYNEGEIGPGHCDDGGSDSIP
jgi:hypothetical protein